MSHIEALEIITDTRLTCAKKAKALGYKRTTVCVDGKRKTGWVNGESLFLTLKNLINHHQKYPLGFDHYHWGQLED